MDSSSRLARARRHRARDRYARAAKTRKPKAPSAVPKLPRVMDSLPGGLVASSEEQSHKYEPIDRSVSDRATGSSSKWTDDTQRYGGNLSDSAVSTEQMQGQYCGHFCRRVPKRPLPPSLPPLSRMVEEKTKDLNITSSLLTNVQEMSRHLRIVNWLWAQEGESSASTNLVVVRRNSHNWYDCPRLMAPRETQFTPFSVDSDLKSDFEQELMDIM